MLEQHLAQDFALTLIKYIVILFYLCFMGICFYFSVIASGLFGLLLCEHTRILSTNKLNLDIFGYWVYFFNP